MSKVAFALVLVVLIAISHRTPRFNSCFGYLHMVAYFLAHSVLYKEDFSVAIKNYTYGIFLANLFAVFVDGNWFLSALVNSSMGGIFWHVHSSTHGSKAQEMQELNFELAGLLIVTGWWSQYLRRKIFYQSICLEENSSRWLSFLHAHPDPIAVFS